MKWIYGLAALGILLTGQAFAQASGDPGPRGEPGPDAPVPTLVFRTTATIPMPRVLEVDGSVSCRLDDDVLRCTARVPVGAAE